MASNFQKLEESAIDDYNEYGYNVSLRQFQNSRYKRWKLV